MDDLAKEAITAMRWEDFGQRQKWFEGICDTYRLMQESGTPEWVDFQTAFTRWCTDNSLGSEPPAQFTEWLGNATSTPLDVIHQMAGEGNNLPTLYDELLLPRWNSLLAGNGPRWNGTEQSWDAFKEWFRYEADEAGVQTLATSFLDYVESSPDKIDAFADYGITIQRPAPQKDDTGVPGAGSVEPAGSDRPPLPATALKIDPAAVELAEYPILRRVLDCDLSEGGVRDFLAEYGIDLATFDEFDELMGEIADLEPAETETAP